MGHSLDKVSGLQFVVQASSLPMRIWRAGSPHDAQPKL